MNPQIAEIAKKHKDWVNIARSFGCKTEAEDVVQEMYIRLDKYIKPDQKISTSFVWITLRNIYFDFLKKEPLTFELDNTVSEAVSETESIVAYENLTSLMKYELNDIHWFDKMLFQLYVTSGKSMRQLAKETKLSLSCIFYTINRTKTHLQSLLNEDYEDYLNEDYEWLKEKQQD
jgi:RNA polymerase sigma factor (sigma-70 family)